MIRLRDTANTQQYVPGLITCTVRTAFAILEQRGLSAVALDADECVLHVAPSAERHLHDGLEVFGRRLCPTVATDTAALSRLVRAICNREPETLRLHVPLHRNHGKRPLVAFGGQIPDAPCGVLQPAVGLLVISDPDHQQDIPLSLIKSYFGLTEAETGLAAALLQGSSVAEYASARRVSITTARNQLQALFQKTATHRQAELVTALIRVVPRK